RLFAVSGNTSNTHRILVDFDYSLQFTRGIFDIGNPSLIEVLSRRERRRHRCVVVVDSGVADAWPRLGEHIRAYMTAHAEALELVCDPVVVDGGERCKNDPAALERLQRLLFERGIDRQSFVLIIGGGAVLDLAGY